MHLHHSLVTGGAGFLGTNLCERLLADGARVTCVDNFFSGTAHNVEHLLSNSRFELMRHDINTQLLVDVDDIYHLACPASPVYYQRNPVQTIRTCIQGTMNMLEMAREVNARILIASTSEVYGDPEVHPQHEQYWGNVNPVGIRACYDEGKRCAEALAISYAKQFHVAIRIPRIFNTYGPYLHMDDGRVVSNFIMQALEKKPITLYGDGEQTRSFCYVDDMIDGLIKLMQSDVTEPINLGNPHECTMRQLAEHIIRLTGSQSSIICEPLPSDDPKRRQPDISKATEQLLWRPTTPLEAGLSATTAYFRKMIRLMA